MKSVGIPKDYYYTYLLLSKFLRDGISGVLLGCSTSVRTEKALYSSLCFLLGRFWLVEEDNAQKSLLHNCCTDLVGLWNVCLESSSFQAFPLVSLAPCSCHIFFLCKDQEGDILSAYLLSLHMTLS
jgi:hypothetical protein